MSPRDRYLTVHGRKPVLEALETGQPVARIHLAERLDADFTNRVLDLARAREVRVERTSDRRLTAIARSGQHQGVVADVQAPRMVPLMAFLEQRTGRLHATTVLVLDHIHNPANLGMILRTATAAGIDGVVVPDVGTAAVGPVAIKASAGVAFHAPILRVDKVEYAVTQLADARFEIVGLEAGGDSLFDCELAERIAVVVGNETDGLSEEVRAACHRSVSLPLANGVESLNVAVAASVVAYEMVRRALS
jgi:23S rRNA (guanosine2251-2'-O)-methyltransferase